jgi:hypothetical protein
VHLLLVGEGEHPTITWDLGADTLVLDGAEISPRAVFVRHDVFAEERSSRVEVTQRAHAWYATVMGWIDDHPEVRCPNRGSKRRALWKPAVLHEAARAGLAVPASLVSNDLLQVRAFARGRPAVAKPIDGGDYCRRLDDVLGHTEVRGDRAAASPAIVQPELVAPELRIYGIGGRLFAFRIHSQALDYRIDDEARIELLPSLPAPIAPGLRALVTTLGLDFWAADFKTSAESGELLFLEINDAPMFAGFDHAAGGAICDAIVELLTTAE